MRFCRQVSGRPRLHEGMTHRSPGARNPPSGPGELEERGNLSSLHRSRVCRGVYRPGFTPPGLRAPYASMGNTPLPKPTAWYLKPLRNSKTIHNQPGMSMPDRSRLGSCGACGDGRACSRRNGSAVKSKRWGRSSYEFPRTSDPRVDELPGARSSRGRCSFHHHRPT